MQRWYAIRVFAELVALRNLAQQGFGTYLPFEVDDRGERPLIRGYLFCEFDVHRDRWRSILGTRGVRTILGLCGDTPLPIPVGEVEKLQDRALRGDFDYRIHTGPPIEYLPGERVSITGGSCEGHGGICIKNGKDGIRILVDMFGGKWPATVRREWVEPAAGEPVKREYVERAA